MQDWRLSGLIDFGDVMTGWGEYDLLGPSAFMTAGHAAAGSQPVEGFGYSSADIDPAMKRRLMALMLLHRSSNLDQRTSASRIGNRRPATSSNCRSCFGRSGGAARSHSKEAIKIVCSVSKQIRIFVCNLAAAAMAPTV